MSEDEKQYITAPPTIPLPQAVAAHGQKTNENVIEEVRSFSDAVAMMFALSDYKSTIGQAAGEAAIIYAQSLEARVDNLEERIKALEAEKDG